MDVYLDNASTTFPKPKVVADSIYDYITNIGGNTNRGNYSNSLEGNRILLSTRKIIADFFNFDLIENVIFTNNITMSLNILIKGILNEGDHVISSTMEHNSVLRPLNDCVQNKGVELSLIKANTLGFIDVSSLESLIKTNTKAVILSHASNVTGSVQNLIDVGNICKKHNLFFIIDTAQSAGTINVDMKELNANAIAFTGHKSLYGPQGIGGFIIDNDLNNICKPLLSGGTGSLSHSLTQPDFLPDKFECGTLNMLGIVGLNRAISFINSTGRETIKEKILFLRDKLYDGLSNIDGIKIFGSKNNSTTCISFTYKDIDPSEVSFYLSENGIKTRAGLHCAPLAHKSIGSYPAGTSRLSLSYFNTIEEIDYTLSIINNLNKEFK